MRLMLDDLRLPTTNHAYMDSEMKQVLSEGQWHVVRHYKDFIQWITSNGLPEFIMFDHDLEYVCVVDNPKLINDNEIIINGQTHYDKNQPNGVACAKWLIEYCKTNMLSLPPYLCHSQNDMGKATLLWVLDNYQKNN